MAATCPCCGAPVRRATLRVDLDTNTLVSAGNVIALTPREAEIAHTLLARYPAVVGYDALIRTVWGSQEPADVMNVLKSIKCHLCRKLRKIGFDIRVVYTRGYALQRIPTCNSLLESS